jgi:hypothetical protein
MPDAATNSCPDLPASPPVADLESRTVLTDCLAAHAALAELRLTAQPPSTPAMAAVMTHLQAQDPAAIASGQAPPCRAAPSQARREDRPVAIAEAVTTRPSRCGRAGSPSAAGAILALAAWEGRLKLPSQLDPLIGMAVQHPHLLARQPFACASGPTGRIFDLLALLKERLIDAPNLNLRGYLWRSPGGFDRLLAGVTTCGVWQPWLLCMLRATELAAAWSSDTIPTIRAVLEATVAQVRVGAPKHFTPELLELIFLEPCRRSGDLVARGPSEPHHASCVLKELVRLSILREERCGRAKIFVNRSNRDLLASDEPAFGPDPRRVARVASRHQAKAQAA